MSNKKLKICFIVGNLPPVKCGIGDYTYRLLEELEKDDNLELSVITSSYSYHKFSKIKLYNLIDVWNFSAWKIIKNLIKKISPDIIHYQHPSKLYKKYLFQFYLPYLAKKNFRKIKFLTTIHEFTESPFYAKLWLKLLLKLNNYIIFTNLHDFKHAIKVANIKSKIIPIGSNIKPNKFDANLLKQEKRKILKDNELLLGYFGTINRDKGLDILIKALNFLKNEQKTKIKLCIIGELSNEIRYHRYIKNLINKYNLKNDVYLTGYLKNDEISKWFNLFDICVLPFKQGASLRRGSLITALVHNIPVITTKGKNNNILTDNNNVVYFNNLTELIAKINRLKNDKIFYQKIKNGTQQVSKNFSWPLIAKKTIEFYNEILSI